MTVCGQRTDTPGFFTACTAALGARSCTCGDQVKADPPEPRDTHLDTQENR